MAGAGAPVAAAASCQYYRSREHNHKGGSREEKLQEEDGLFFSMYSASWVSFWAAMRSP